MSRLVIVANRLPVTVERRGGKHRFHRSVGGVATGLGSYAGEDERLWIGWAEAPTSRIDAAEREVLRAELREGYDSEPVFLSSDDVARFYHGFSNRTLWPLFHYFARFAEFDSGYWSAYERVNRKYRDAVLTAYEPGDRIWVHDYQLLLLPALLREKLPSAQIGFFLHIPFPSYEIFRMLPWRREILEGMLGANLIGFHTHDYVRHFLGSVRAVVGLDDRNGRLQVGKRLVLTDAFPMGIDYDRYAKGVNRPGAVRERRRLTRDGRKIVLSVDRLDYTKGIPERLRAFDAFLERHPEWRGRVTLVCVAVPSRSRVPAYRDLKREVDELVGDINGRRGTLDWTPVRYLNRSLSQDTLLGMYSAADVALVTPLRDGMNLIAKEYVAAREGCDGVLVLSEMAGAARELDQAIIVNPNDLDAMVAAIEQALEMPTDEQERRNARMRARLKRYDVDRWAADFLGRLDEVMMHQLAFEEYALTPEARERMVRSFATAKRRLLVLDYDGTLMPLKPLPGGAAPDAELCQLLSRLVRNPGTDVVVASGRDRDTLESWLGATDVGLIAEHGAWVRERGGEWGTSVPLYSDWKTTVYRILEVYVDRTPGSFIEEKDFSLAWHYRQVPSDLVRRRSRELREALAPVAESLSLNLLDGDKVLEVKNTGYDKGSAAHLWMGRAEYDFVLAVGDDVTDEDLFEAAPTEAWTLKVGTGPSRAMFDIPAPSAVRALLEAMLDESITANTEPQGETLGVIG